MNAVHVRETLQTSEVEPCDEVRFLCFYAHLITFPFIPPPSVDLFSLREEKNAPNTTIRRLLLIFSPRTFIGICRRTRTIYNKGCCAYHIYVYIYYIFIFIYIYNEILYIYIYILYIYINIDIYTYIVHFVAQV